MKTPYKKVFFTVTLLTVASMLQTMANSALINDKSIDINKLQSYVQLRTFCEYSITNNPSLKAKELYAESAFQHLNWIKESFSTPSLNASIGIDEAPSTTPLSNLSKKHSSNASSAQIGVEAPLVKGVYGGFGARQEQLINDGATDGDSVSTAGIYLRIPFFKDSGFALNKFESDIAEQQYIISLAEIQNSSINLIKDTSYAFFDYIMRINDAKELHIAYLGAQNLANDASEKAKLQDIAEYQIYSAVYEEAKREEEYKNANLLTENAIASLKNSLGTTNDIYTITTVSDSFSDFINFAESISSLKTENFKSIDISTTLPSLIIANAKINEKKQELNLIIEQEKSELDLSVQGGWISNENDTNDNSIGYSIALSYSVPLGKASSRHHIATAELELKALQEEYKKQYIEAEIQRDKSIITFQNACNRLSLADKTVLHAKKVLESEQARFDIGEGNSRSVLDAQNYLTTASRKKLSIATEVLKAYIDLYICIGLSPID